MLIPANGIKFTGSAAPVLVHEAEDFDFETNFLCFYSPAAGLFLWQFTRQTCCYECAGQEALTEFGAGSRSEVLDALRSTLTYDPERFYWGPGYVREAAEAVHNFYPPYPRYMPETPADEAAAARAFVEVLARADELDAARAEELAKWKAEEAKRLAVRETFMARPVLASLMDPEPEPFGNSVRILPAE